MKYKSFGLAASIILAAIAPSAAMAQSLGGSIASKEVDSYVSGWPDLLSMATWSDWKYTDASGTVHTFAGSTKATYHYIFYADGRQPRFTGIVYTSLTNVQATDGSLYYLTAKGGDATVNGYGTLHPKYQVVSVAYAPPGTGANVSYATSTGVGNTTNISRQFSQGYNISVEAGASFLGLAKGSSTFSGGWTDSTTQSNSLSINKTTTNSLTASGQESPAPAYGIDHDYDVIYICLNPVVAVSTSVSNGSTNAPPTWTMGCDTRDTTSAEGPDIIPLTVAQLKNPSLITNVDDLNRLARTWAGSNEGLTTEDFTNILARDPFCNDGTNGTRPVIDSTRTDNRFQLINSVPYDPLYPGQGAQVESGTLAYTQTTNQSTSTVDTYSVSLETKGEINVFVKLGLEATATYTWTNTKSQSVDLSQGQTVAYSIPRPPSTWMGKTVINVYQDTIYGTFFFSY